MADLCIVCLGELRTSIAENTSPQPPDTGPLRDEASHGSRAEVNTRSVTTSIQSDEDAIAHLLPCKHDLHNACLKPWVERANSCPICRATFNMVELSLTVNGQVLDSYAVQDKIQEAEVDPTMFAEDELFAVEAWEPCLICGVADDSHETMYCDSCEKAVHVFCAGHEDSPEVWYCSKCLDELDQEAGNSRMSAGMRRATRRHPVSARNQPRSRNPDRVWAQVWREVSRRLDLDLDFPFDEEPQDQRTEEQRREFERWQRRFEVANHQGVTNRLREIADARAQAPLPEPVKSESQEVIRAWNAFEKARESQDAPASVRRRKRMATASPVSPSEPDPVEPPQQKRPRLRRPLNQSTHPVAESSNAAAQRASEGPTFLSSLLREVENQPTAASSPGLSEQQNGHTSPVLSPASSGYGTPRAVSPQRPLSPPLSSTSVPLSPHNIAATSPLSATFSPFSPVAFSQDERSLARNIHQRGRKRQPADRRLSGDDVANTIRDRASSASPSRNLSFSAKQEIQRMVKSALGPRYRNKEITKDQYTEINRDVSRNLYDLVGDASALADQAERERWQAVADEQVVKLVAALAATPPPAEWN